MPLSAPISSLRNRLSLSSKSKRPEGDSSTPPLGGSSPAGASIDSVKEPGTRINSLGYSSIRRSFLSRSRPSAADGANGSLSKRPRKDLSELFEKNSPEIGNATALGLEELPRIDVVVSKAPSPALSRLGISDSEHDLISQQQMQQKSLEEEIGDAHDSPNEYLDIPGRRETSHPVRPAESKFPSYPSDSASSAAEGIQQGRSQPGQGADDDASMRPLYSPDDPQTEECMTESEFNSPRSQASAARTPIPTPPHTRGHTPSGSIVLDTIARMVLPVVPVSIRQACQFPVSPDPQNMEMHVQAASQPSSRSKRSSVDWTSAEQAMHLLDISLSEAQMAAPGAYGIGETPQVQPDKTPPQSAFARQLFIQGVARMIKSLPVPLSLEECNLLRNALCDHRTELSLVEKVASTPLWTGWPTTAPANSRQMNTMGGTVAVAGAPPTFLHHFAAMITLAAVASTHFFLPIVIAVISSISSSTMSTLSLPASRSPLDTFLAIGTLLINIVTSMFARVAAFRHGRVGRVAVALLLWATASVVGGISEGLAVGWRKYYATDGDESDEPDQAVVLAGHKQSHPDRAAAAGRPRTETTWSAHTASENGENLSAMRGIGNPSAEVAMRSMVLPSIATLAAFLGPR